MKQRVTVTSRTEDKGAPDGMREGSKESFIKIEAERQVIISYLINRLGSITSHVRGIRIIGRRGEKKEGK